MATANVELGGIAHKTASGFALRGSCLRSEDLAISGSTATLTTAVTKAESDAGIELATISTDTACYYAIGITPDPDAETKTGLTTARRLLPAGASVDHAIGIGEKVAVKALA